MRLLAAAAGLTLAFSVLASAASAHVTVTPGFLSTETAETLQLAMPNERDDPMTGFELTASSTLTLVEAVVSPPWEAEIDGDVARWSGGSLAAGSVIVFLLEVEGPEEPGAVQLIARQLYDDGESVEWPIALTVVPGEEPSQQLGRALVAAAVGLVVTVGIVGLAWRRRARTLQEK